MSDALTPVERAALAASPFAELYPPTEKIRTLVVDNFPALGRLAALRFLEWVQANPEGVVSLPTGKTPEHFIKWVVHLLRSWEEPATRRLLEEKGADPALRPRTEGLRFVQMDEFYPIPSKQENSFHAYVTRFYLGGFGLDPERAMLMDGSAIGLPEGETLETVWPGGEVDLTLRFRMARTALERTQKEVLARVDEWCQEYEDRVRSMGGIGFFLGGIGPDGHVAFNVRGADHHATTRLTDVNFETQAAAAGALGGIEVSRTRKAISIGLGTVTHNPACVALVIAAGEAKAGVVGDAVQSAKGILHPATALHALPNARFYVTLGAAHRLRERRLAAVVREEALPDDQAERAAVDLALESGKRLVDLTEENFARSPLAAAVLRRRPESAEELAAWARDRLAGRIEAGSAVRSGTRFFHTEPHHDDIMLGYLPHVVRHIRDASNDHHFYTMTSGFTAVTNAYLAAELANLRAFLRSPDCSRLDAEGYFRPDDETCRNRDVWQYLDGVAAEQPKMRAEGAARRLLRDLVEVFGEAEPDRVEKRAVELEAYLAGQYPGGKDPAAVQKIKGMRREWEAECLWGYFGWECSHVRHLRLGFYTGDLFTEDPSVERDALPILDELRRVGPDVVSVALDPEGSGPDTHYKVMQAMSAALRRYERESGRGDLAVLGYRNVWYRFHPSEANLYVPISLQMFATMSSAFSNTFVSQKDASFPSHEHDGPFCELAQAIQVEQYQMLKTCLGRQWFHEHRSPLVRAARGFVFLREMAPAEFYRHSRELMHAAENR